jgi:outer membrane protein OmpA-like peptidoglycan-associated protein
LAESNDVEAALNGLDQILFQSGTDVILAESLPVLDEAAALMIANPDLTFEVGGHTDSRGDDASNQSLSERRSAAVVAALVERDVANELTPRGFGETRLQEDPDDTAEQQQINRRIEFRIL